MYLIRLDDASEFMDVHKWSKMENLLDKYYIKPIIGVIPNNKDSNMVDKYDKDENFWKKVSIWQQKGYTIALHGYEHLYHTQCGGINPVNHRSEFAGVSLEEQCKKIHQGVKMLNSKNIYPKIFFAPSHTFDNNTLKALNKESEINIISDTIANDIYFKEGFYFIPQQTGRVRRLPFKVVTFCYHPNVMNEEDFCLLEKFLYQYHSKFTHVENLKFKKRGYSVYDRILNRLYFGIRKIR